MADDDESLLGDDVGTPAPAKKRGIGSLFTGFLRWIIIAISAIIVIVVISLVTTLIVTKHKTSSSATVYQSGMEEHQANKEVFDWYKSIGVIQTTTCDDNPATVRVDVYLGYKQDDKACSTEITQRSVELKDFLRQYFRSKTAAELKNANNEDKLKMEIRNGINDKVLSSSKIRSISFNQLDVVDPN